MALPIVIPTPAFHGHAVRPSLALPHCLAAPRPFRAASLSSLPARSRPIKASLSMSSSPQLSSPSDEGERLDAALCGSRSLSPPWCLAALKAVSYPTSSSSPSFFLRSSLSLSRSGPSFGRWNSGAPLCMRSIAHSLLPPCVLPPPGAFILACRCSSARSRRTRSRSRRRSTLASSGTVASSSRGSRPPALPSLRRAWLPTHARAPAHLLLVPDARSLLWPWISNRFDTQDGLYDVAWSELNENQLVAASGDGALRLFDVKFPVQLVAP